MATDPGFAPAKINLTLHVTGKRADGYHLLDSLVAFADIGDRISVRQSERLSLAVTGPEARDLSAADDNLVVRAARMMGVTDAAMTLEKHLPVASGIGGGSSDAAAALRVLAARTGGALPSGAEASRLGADVPVCLKPAVTRMAGIGDLLQPGPVLPEFWFLLVNPRIAVPTPDVFRALSECDNAPMPDMPQRFGDLTDFAGFLQLCRNDLQPPAVSLVPVISQVLNGLDAQPGCRLARMSGSGATCFGLFRAEADAARAACAIRSDRPAWWIAAARRLD